MSEREEYTPTMAELRQGYVYGAAPLPAYYSKDHPVAQQVYGEQFDRAIAAHDKALREQIAQDIEAHIHDDGTDEWFAATELATCIALGEVSR